MDTVETTFNTGIDIGSTTAKVVICDKSGRIIFSSYRRHKARTLETTEDILKDALHKLGDIKLDVAITGSAGMGIAGLLTSTIGLISALTNFGLGTSAVRDIATANSTGDEIRIATVVTVLSRWVWVTGILGTFVTLILTQSGLLGQQQLI